MPTVTDHPPVKPITKHQFKSPLDMLETAAELKGVALGVPPPLDLKPLLGTWLNCDKNTRGIPKLELAASGTALSIHVWGACTPTLCDWKIVPAKAFADSVSTTSAVAFTALYKFSFVETTVIGRLQFGALFVETFDHFIDGSGREDYNAVYVMSK
jgi:hypothetical protein